jgi:hypothetical protein
MSVLIFARCLVQIAVLPFASFYLSYFVCCQSKMRANVCLIKHNQLSVSDALNIAIKHSVYIKIQLKLQAFALVPNFKVYF